MPRAKSPEKEIERKEKCRQAALSQWNRDRENLVRIHRECAKNPVTREKLTKSRRALMADKERKDAMFAKINATRATPEVQAVQTRKQRESWKDPEIRARRIAGIKKAAVTERAILKSITNLGSSFSNHPNKFEQRYIDVLDKQWVYTGSGGKGNIIGGKIPDFTHRTNKKLIELFGDYWHRGENEQERIDHFAQYGYETLVIWEHESIESALARIKKFEPVEPAEMTGRLEIGC